MSASFTIYEDEEARHFRDAAPVSERGGAKQLQRHFINPTAARLEPQQQSYAFDHLKVCKLDTHTQKHSGKH